MENNKYNWRLQKYIDEKINNNTLKSFPEIRHYIDNYKSSMTTICTIFTIFLSGAYVTLGFEKIQIYNFKRETRKELLGELNKEAQIIIKAQNGGKLKGQTIKIDTIEKIVRANKDEYYHTPKYKFRYSITFENTGEGLAKNPFMKLYYNKEFSDHIMNPNNVDYATDETEYDYESTVSLKNSALEDLPPNVSYSHTLGFNQFGNMKPGIYPFKIKIFYGKKNKITESEFFIEIVDNPKIVEIIKDASQNDNKQNIESTELGQS